MRVAVALLFVLAACAIFVAQADQCVANTTGNRSTSHTNQVYYDDNGDNEDTTDNGGDQGPSGMGAVTGVILSSAGSHAVPNANVALYDEYGNLADVPENPQLSSNGTGNNGGVYMFYDVPCGIYTVTAEKGGVEFFAMVNLSSGTATANVVLPEYVETEPAYQEPEITAPAPRPFRYFLPVTIGRMPDSAAPDEGLPFGLAAIGGIGALILFTHKNGWL